MNLVSGHHNFTDVTLVSGHHDFTDVTLVSGHHDFTDVTLVSGVTCEASLHRSRALACGLPWLSSTTCIVRPTIVPG